VPVVLTRAYPRDDWGGVAGVEDGLVSDKQLVALEISDARLAGYSAVWDRLEDADLRDERVPVWEVWRAVYAYQAATERALLGNDAPEPDLMSKPPT
jgi:hypothetical protein